MTDTIAKTVARRKSRFKAALALTGTKAWQFAAAQGMDPSRLTRVLNGDLADEALLAEIDTYANATLAKAADESAA